MPDRVQDNVGYALLLAQRGEKLINRTRAVSGSGILSKYFREVEEAPENLIGKSDELDNDELEIAWQFLCAWKQSDRKYLLKQMIES